MMLSIVKVKREDVCAVRTAAAQRRSSLRMRDDHSAGGIREDNRVNACLIRAHPWLQWLSMKVARIHQHGGPDALVYEDAPEPTIKANQVLIRVRACALNHLDLFVRAGLPGMKFAMPHVLGSDIAGEVAAVGDLCERVKPGWRVLLSPGLSCRQCDQCLSGKDNYCRRYTLFGYGAEGGNAEQM